MKCFCIYSLCNLKTVFTHKTSLTHQTSWLVNRSSNRGWCSVQMFPVGATNRRRNCWQSSRQWSTKDGCDVCAFVWNESSEMLQQNNKNLLEAHSLSAGAATAESFRSVRTGTWTRRRMTGGTEKPGSLSSKQRKWPYKLLLGNLRLISWRCCRRWVMHHNGRILFRNLFLAALVWSSQTNLKKWPLSRTLSTKIQVLILSAATEP